MSNPKAQTMYAKAVKTGRDTVLLIDFPYGTMTIEGQPLSVIKTVTKDNIFISDDSFIGVEGETTVQVGYVEQDLHTGTPGKEWIIAGTEVSAAEYKDLVEKVSKYVDDSAYSDFELSDVYNTPDEIVVLCQRLRKARYNTIVSKVKKPVFVDITMTLLIEDTEKYILMPFNLKANSSKGVYTVMAKEAAYDEIVKVAKNASEKYGIAFKVETAWAGSFKINGDRIVGHTLPKFPRFATSIEKAKEALEQVRQDAKAAALLYVETTVNKQMVFSGYEIVKRLMNFHELFMKVDSKASTQASYRMAHKELLNILEAVQQSAVDTFEKSESV